MKGSCLIIRAIILISLRRSLKMRSIRFRSNLTRIKQSIRGSKLSMHRTALACSRSSSKYAFESKDYEHLNELKYSQIFNHIFNRFPAEPVKIYEANLDTFLECHCWKEHDQKFGGDTFI